MQSGVRSLLILLIGVVTHVGHAADVQHRDPFPLGELPAGWSYRVLSGFERRLEALPFEVKGVLERKLDKDRSVVVYVTISPLKRGPARLPASVWQWVDSTFVQKASVTPRTYVLNEQSNVGYNKKWNYREATVSRAGVPMNLAAFQAANKFANVFLVLRQDNTDYAGNLLQLKELAASLKWTP